MKVKNSESPAFLTGGGHMGELIRSYDWSNTSIGSPDTWPQSLRIAVRIMLDCPFGMYIAWGSEYIQLYNDGYRPILGATKHPQALGISTRKTFEEIWTTIGPMFDGVMEGTPVGFPDFILHMDRNGFLEECVFDFSYSPIRLEDGKVGGVLVTVIETTEKVKAVKALKESLTDVSVAKLAIQKSEENLRNTIMQAPVAMCIFKGENFIVDLANDRMFELWGKPAKEVMNKPIFEGLPEAKNQGFEALLQGVYTTGKTYSADALPINLPRNGHIELVYVNFVYAPHREADGNISGILALAIDVTDQITASKKIEESEAKFRTLSGSIPHMIWTATPDGNKNFFNQYFLDYTGLSFDELKGDGWQKIIFPDDLERELKHWDHAIQTGEDFKIEKRIRFHDGTYQWHLAHGIAQKDKEGNITGWIGTNTGIEEQRKFTEELEHKVKERTYQLHIQNETFKQAEESSMQGSYSFNLTTGKLTYSDNLFRLIGYEPNEFEPSLEEFNKHVHPEDRDYVTQSAEKVVTSKTADEWHYRMNTKTGNIINIKGTGRVIESVGEKLLVGTLQDITKDVAGAEELKEKNLALELTNAELKSFSYIASHDLKEPLRKIQAFSKRILETEHFSDKTQDYFNRIISAGERMQNLIESLLDLSLANTAELVFEPCDLNRIVEEAKSDLYECILEKEAVIETENLPTINGASIQITQLITNLLDNAIKYSRPGIKPHIKISSSIIEGKRIGHPSANNQKEYYAIKIADNGIGFEQQHTTKIFDLFKRLHHKNEYPGTGIGLSISKKIATNHNGFIIAEGKPDIGSIFTIYIPTT